MLEGKATHYAARCTPRKARLLRPLILGRDVASALAVLKVERRAGARDVIKLITSAMAQIPNGRNAIVSEFIVNEGPKRRMYMPRARGRACPVWKRTSHLSVRLKLVE